MIKVRVFNATGASSKDGDMNEFGVIKYHDGEIMHLSRALGSVMEIKEEVKTVSSVRSEQEKKPKKKG